MSDFSWLIEWPRYIPDLLPGLGVALLLTLFACAIGYPIGLLLALATDTKISALRYAVLTIVEVGRGLPILVLLYLVYQGLPQVDIVLDALPSAVLVLTWSSAAYSAEMIRASIASVPRGQFEASLAVSLSQRDLYRYVVLPQASRIAIPPLVNLTITMFHATSLTTVITVAEIMHAAYFHGSITFQYMTVYFAAAIVYAAIAIPGALFAGWLERRIGSPVGSKITVARVARRSLSVG